MVALRDGAGSPRVVCSGAGMTSVAEWAVALLEVASSADWANGRYPGRRVIGNSTIDWSSPCDGLLGVEMLGFDYAGETFPNPSSVTRGPFGRPCADDIWMARWDVSIVSCADTFAGDDGAAASPDRLNANAAELFGDAHAVWTALRTYDWPSPSSVIVGGYRPLARTGNASGYAVSVTTKVTTCP